MMIHSPEAKSLQASTSLKFQVLLPENPRIYSREHEISTINKHKPHEWLNGHGYFHSSEPGVSTILSVLTGRPRDRKNRYNHSFAMGAILDLGVVPLKTPGNHREELG